METFPALLPSGDSSHDHTMDILDAGPSFIMAPVPRKHHTLQLSESQHWLGSPPLSPVSAVSRTLSPLSHTSTSPTLSRKRHNSSFAAFASPDPRYPLPAGPSRPRIQLDSAKEETGTARRWIRWMHKQGIRRYIMPLLVLCSVLVARAAFIGGGVRDEPKVDK